MKRFILIIALCCLTAPAVVLADLKQFIPHIYSTGGDLEINVSHENNENLTAGRGTQTSDTFSSEKIVLTVNGFVYHPRFLLFLGKLGGGFSQEEFSSSTAARDVNARNNMFVHEYEFRTLLLPEHPYNLELFVLRHSPLVLGRANPEVSSVILSKGALFTYKQRPFQFKLNYITSDTESSRSVSESENLSSFGSYFTENFSLSGAVSRSVAKNSSGSENKLLNYSIQNQIRLFQKKVYFTSTAGQIFSDQRSVTTINEGNRLSWTEQLNMYLPWNFNTIITYGYFKDEERSRDIDTEAKGKTESTSNDEGLSITHMLYESLRSAYNFHYIETLTGTGDSKVTTNSLSTSYSKKIPWGKLFAGLQLSNSVLERTGAPAVTEENIEAKILGEFTLKESDINGESIRVFVIDPVTSGPIELTNSVHYSVNHVGDTFKVFIIDVPVEAKDPDPSHEYTFRIKYSFNAGSFEIERMGFGYNLKLELFDRLVNPYYVYTHEKERVLSGALTGGADELTTHTVGLELRKQPYSLLTEYESHESLRTPWKRYRTEAHYWQNFGIETYFDARAYYTKVQHLASSFDPESTTETSTGIDLRINKRYTRRHLTVTALGSYSSTKRIFKTDTYALGASVTWRVAKLDLSLGANVYRAESELGTGTAQRTNQTYYLSLKRNLF